MSRGADSRLFETHGSWVVITGDDVVKIKKPVRFAFMDLSTPERRRRACEEEVRVNQALAPGIYRGTGDLDGEPIVRMRRFDEQATMAALLAAGRLRQEDVARAARRIAAFHAGAERCHMPEPETWRAQAAADLDDLAGLGHDVAELRLRLAAGVRRWGDEMQRREAAGLVRDGHGDLRADHVVCSDPLLVVDRIEFSRALRVADVADDLAFLTMDLEWLGARWAADALRSAYTKAGGLPGPPGLAALFAWRRALVRAKVAGLSGRPDEAAALVRAADRWCWRSRAPVRLAVFGPPASGKSTLATALAERLELPVVSTDVVRRELHDVRRYTRAERDEVYREVTRRARAVAPGGVIVDGTFAEGRHRAALERALGDVVWVGCDAPPAVLAARAEARRHDPTRLSDAGPQVALRIAARFDPPDGLARFVALDATRSVAELVEETGRRLDG
jgi:aminoglycoside phosphotransferase family enzyme/predicted kinase